jgi:hypothetical protein
LRVSNRTILHIVYKTRKKTTIITFAAFSIEIFDPWSSDAKEVFKDLIKLLLEKSSVSQLFPAKN